MSTHFVYLVNSFLIFTIILSSSINCLTLAETNAAVTDKLIQRICNETRKPSLCLKNLNPLKGKSLHENPISVLGGSSMNEAQSRANRTVDLVWSHYRSVSVHKPEIRVKYYNCFLSYKVVINQLKEAKRHMSGGAGSFVKKYVAAAADRVSSCDRELMKPPRGESTVLDANGYLKDLCSIILAICKNMS
ncbi:hypothetical protein ABFX02_01G012100 [Erythranthe guttata]